MAKVTQGKWFNNGGRIYAQQGDDIREICDVGMINCQSEEDTANARLIVATPDLLGACKLVDRATVGDGVEMITAIDACLLAIAKAEKGK